MRMTLSIIVAAVAIATAPAATQASSCQTLTVTEKQNHAAVSLPIGGTLIVRLQSNVTTGYAWQTVALSGIVLRAVGKPQNVAATSGLMGAPGQQIFVFDAVAAGSVPLTLNYARPWEKGKTPGKTFQVTVQVK